MKTLPLFYYPSTWIWVDDDHTLLQAMTKTFGAQNTIESFTSSEDCVRFLEKYKSPLSECNFIHFNEEDENYGLTSKNPMNFDLRKIAKLYHEKTRHDEITLAIIDYQMPVSDGFSLSERIRLFPMQKILLTGNIQKSKAIEGFNRNLIQKFIQKNSNNMNQELLYYTNELSRSYFEIISRPFLTYLEAENKIALSDPVFIDYFEEYCDKNEIVEYYIINKQGSFLCINKNGKKLFLIVHTNISIKEWISIYGDEGALSNKSIVEITEGEKIPFFGYEKEEWETPCNEWTKKLYNAEILSGRETYYIASIKE